MKGGTFIKSLLLTVLVVAAAALAALVWYLSRQWNRTTFYENSVINGFDASNRIPEDLLPEITAAYSAPSVHVLENGTEEMVYTLESLGYAVDQTKLLSGLEDALSRQKSSVAVMLDSLLHGNSFEISVPFTFDENRFRQTVKVAAFAEPRVQNADAYVTYDAGSKTYSIVPEIQGTLLNDADVQALVRGEVDKLIAQEYPQGDLKVSIPADLYIKPSITAGDSGLNTMVNVYNSYDKAKITYTFGDQTESIDWDTIKDWVFIENETGYISEDSIRNYVTSLASRYNTYHYERVFQTTYGNEIVFGDVFNEYGYLVDENGEYEQLLRDIQSNSSVEREPIYAYRGVGRSGRNDMLQYVEVNLSAQHLWFYKNGGLVVESDIVSGCVSRKQETQTGIYPIAYKESPATLIPSNETNGTNVQYWMPFYDGQGLHDASWRYQFGGSIYRYQGSHGCVNLPPAVAAVIFENVDTGTPVVLYK